MGIRGILFAWMAVSAALVLTTAACESAPGDGDGTTDGPGVGSPDDPGEDLTGDPLDDPGDDPGGGERRPRRLRGSLGCR